MYSIFLAAQKGHLLSPEEFPLTKPYFLKNNQESKLQFTSARLLFLIIDFYICLSFFVSMHFLVNHNRIKDSIENCIVHRNAVNIAHVLN